MDLNYLIENMGEFQGYDSPFDDSNTGIFKDNSSSLRAKITREESQPGAWLFLDYAANILEGLLDNATEQSWDKIRDKVYGNF